MSTRAALEIACDDLEGRRLPDDEGRRLMVQVARASLDRPPQTADDLPRREAKAQRDRHLIELASQHCHDLTEIRPRVRRILTWESYPAHPLRKDYPLRGRGERETFEVIKRDSA